MMSDICDFSCVWNSDIKQNIHGVMDSIVAAFDTPTPDPSPPQGGGEDTLPVRGAPQ